MNTKRLLGAGLAFWLALALLCGCASSRKKDGWSVTGNWGPGFRIERESAEEPASPPDGNVTIQIEAGEDVGYHVSTWRDKPFVEGQTTHDPEPKKER